MNALGFGRLHSPINTPPRTGPSTSLQAADQGRNSIRTDSHLALTLTSPPSVLNLNLPATSTARAAASSAKLPPRNPENPRFNVIDAIDTNAREEKHVLQPMEIGAVPKEDGDMLSGEERTWYTGFLHPWTSFQTDVIKFSKSELFRRAFSETNRYPTVEPRISDLQHETNHNSKLLVDHFQREIIEVVEVLYNHMTETLTTQYENAPTKLILTQAADEGLGNLEHKWDPKFVLRKQISGGRRMKVIGHAEYLAGKSGALTWAIKEQAQNSWGSLRCVLGDMAKWMLMGRIRYGFLTSRDEVIFLLVDIDEFVERERVGQDEIDEVDLMKAPKLHYSAPIKHSDILDEADKTVPVRLALLYLLNLGMKPKWVFPDDIGRALDYAATTKANEDLKLKPIEMYRG